MSNDLIKERIVLNKFIGKETTQLLIEGEMIVPDIKPDMAMLLKTNAELCFDKTEISSERINFNGKLIVKVLYFAKGLEKSIHSMTSTHIIDDFVNMEGLEKDMWVDLCGNITNIEFRVLNDRKLSYKAVIDISVNGEAKTSYDLLSHITDIPEVQIARKTINTQKTIDKREESFVIRDELIIPQNKPAVRDLLQVTASVANKDIKIGNGKASISGDIVVYTLYKGDDEDSVIDFCESEIPFNGTIDIPESRDTMTGDLVLTVLDQKVNLKSDGDGEDRVLDVEITLLSSVKVTCSAEYPVLEDAYIVNKRIDFCTEKVLYSNLVCRNRSQSPIKEVIELDEDCPDILQIFDAAGRVQIDEIRLIEDKAVIEGIIETDILYIAKNDEAPLYNFKSVIPYKQIIEARGTNASMHAEVSKSVDHIGFNMLSDREMELRFLINFNTKVYSECETVIITGAEFNDIDKSVLDDMPSMIIYIVQKGDSLWNIAKRYNTSIEDIIEINDLDGGEKLIPGQKLLILKKV